MSYSHFQAAIALAITHPEVVRALRRGEFTDLRHLDLSEREMRRLRGLALQPGMAFYCSLARANRLEAIADAFPMTLVVLESGLGEFLDRLWANNPPSGYRFEREVEQFSVAVDEGLRDDSLRSSEYPYLQEVFGYEKACWELGQSLRASSETIPLERVVVEFDHPPDLLLSPLSRLEAPPADLPRGHYRIEVRLEKGQFKVVEASD